MTHQFSGEDVQLLGRETAFKGFFKISRLAVSHKLFSGEQTGSINRELFERGESVGVLLYDPHQQLIGLVEQFRIGALEDPVSPWLYEIVAGMIDGSDTPQQTAQKELWEEAGLYEVDLRPICHYWVSPGGTNERMHLFCGLTGLPESGGLFGCKDEQEDICFHVLPEEKVFAMLESGEINNAASIIALQWLQLHKPLLV